MHKLIQHFLDLSEPPAWRVVGDGMLCALALFTGPALFIIWTIALGAK